MNTRLPDLLHDLASEIPADVERSAPRVVRRARGRRVATALVATAAVVAIVAGGISALRLAAPERGRVVPLPPGPDAAAFRGLWPETTADALAEAQAQVDGGHQPLRVDPAQTAAMLATNVFGWQLEETRAETVDTTEGVTIVELSNSGLSDDVPPITVEVAQLGRTGPNGVWSVVSVSSPLLDSVRVDAAADGGQASITFAGTLAEVRRSFVVRFEVLRGPVSEEGTIAGEVSLDGRAFSGSAGSWPRDTFDLDDAVLWILVVDGEDRVLAATAVPLRGTDAPFPEPTGTAAPGSEPDFTDLPPDVAVTAQRILDAASAGDVDALAELVDPSVFAYNFGEVDPLATWRGDPSVLDAIPGVLALPPVVDAVEGSPTFYVWPYLMAEGALDDVSEQERADLRALGFSDRAIEQMREFGGYLGPRVGIDETGAWRFYVTGGD
jgi:hypothetical protein